MYERGRIITIVIVSVIIAMVGNYIYETFIETHPNGDDCASLCKQNNMLYDGYYLDAISIRDGYCRCLPMKYSSDNPDFDDRWIKWRAD